MPFSTVLQLYNGRVYHRFQQNYSYTTTKLNSILNIIKVISPRSLTPFLTILQLYQDRVYRRYQHYHIFQLYHGRI